MSYTLEAYIEKRLETLFTEVREDSENYESMIMGLGGRRMASIDVTAILSLYRKYQEILVLSKVRGDNFPDDHDHLIKENVQRCMNLIEKNITTIICGMR